MKSQSNSANHNLHDYLQAVMKNYLIMKYDKEIYIQDSNRLALFIDKHERQLVIDEQLKLIKNEIILLKNTDLVEFFLSSEPEYDRKNWTKYFCQHFLSEYETLTPLTKAIEYYPTAENYDDEYFFNLFWPEHQHLEPRSNLWFSKLLEKENELVIIVDKCIGIPFYDFNFLIPFIEYNKYVEIFFQYCDLLLQLERLTRFNNILESEYPNNSVEPKENINVKQDLVKKENKQTEMYKKKVSYFTVIARKILSSPDSKGKKWKISKFASEISDVNMSGSEYTDLSSGTIASYFYRGDDNELIKLQKENSSMFKK